LFFALTPPTPYFNSAGLWLIALLKQPRDAKTFFFFNERFNSEPAFNSQGCFCLASINRRLFIPLIFAKPPKLHLGLKAEPSFLTLVAKANVYFNERRRNERLSAIRV
jgi:hypothetical protein